MNLGDCMREMARNVVSNYVEGSTLFRRGDRVKIVNNEGNYFQGALGTVHEYTCATARYVQLDSGSIVNFHISNLELVNEPAQDSYMELFL